MAISALSRCAASFENNNYLEELKELIDDLPQHVQHTDLEEYLIILDYEANSDVFGDENRRKAPVFILEKKFYDIASELNRPDELVSVIASFSKLNHQSDKLWELLTKAVINTIPVLPEDLLVKVVKSFSEVKRGSNTLWDFFVKKIHEGFEDFNAEQKVTLLFGKHFLY